MLPGSAAREGYASVFQLADAWPLTEGRFAEECGRILALSAACARCSPSATVISEVWCAPVPQQRVKPYSAALAYSRTTACCPPILDGGPVACRKGAPCLGIAC